MFFLLLGYFISLIAMIAALSFIFIGIKILVMKYFEYYYTKKILIHYIIFYFTILFILMFALFLVLPIMTSNQIFTMIVLPLFLIAFIYEYVIIFKKYFEFESKGQFVINILVSYVGIIIILLIIIPVFLVLITLLSGF